MRFVRPQFLIQLLLCLMLLTGTSGCVTASIITLGSVLGALGSAASTGSSVYKLGKLNSARMVNLSDGRDAVRDAAADLGLRVCADEPADQKKTSWFFALCDRKGDETDVTIERDAPMLCSFRVNVGIFGSQPTAKLIMHRINFHLPGGLKANPD